MNEHTADNSTNDTPTTPPPSVDPATLRAQHIKELAADVVNSEVLADKLRACPDDSPEMSVLSARRTSISVLVEIMIDAHNKHTAEERCRAATMLLQNSMHAIRLPSAEQVGKLVRTLKNKAKPPRSSAKKLSTTNKKHTAKKKRTTARARR